jgi:hypothetical protein
MLRLAAVGCRLNKPDPEVADKVVREIEHTPEGVAIARASGPLERANPAPAESISPTPPQAGPELTSNQDFDYKPLSHNILPEAPPESALQ